MVGFIRKGFLKGRELSLTLAIDEAVPVGQMGAQRWGAHLGRRTHDSPATSARKLPWES